MDVGSTSVVVAGKNSIQLDESLIVRELDPTTKGSVQATLGKGEAPDSRHSGVDTRYICLALRRRGWLELVKCGGEWTDLPDVNRLRRRDSLTGSNVDELHLEVKGPASLSFGNFRPDKLPCHIEKAERLFRCHDTARVAPKHTIEICGGSPSLVVVDGTPIRPRVGITAVRNLLYDGATASATCREREKEERRGAVTDEEPTLDLSGYATILPKSVCRCGMTKDRPLPQGLEVRLGRATVQSSFNLGQHIQRAGRALGRSFRRHAVLRHEL